MTEVSREEFIKQNMGLVGKLASKHIGRVGGNSMIDRDDLVQIGSIGLIKAYDRFDPDYGTKFSTYAVPMIDGEIRRFLRDKLDVIRFSRNSKVDYYEILEAGLINEDPEFISEKINISVHRVERALDYYKYRFIDSMDREVYEDDSTPIKLSDTVSEEVDFDTRLELDMLLNKLDGRERKIIELRLQDKDQTEIGEIMGMSQANISRILQRIQKYYKGEVEMKKEKTESKELPSASNHLDQAKELAATTLLTPTEIRRKTGVSWHTAKKYIEEYREKESKESGRVKTADYVLAKRLSEETELNANQISKQAGVSYSTSQNYIQYYRNNEKVNSRDLSEDSIAGVSDVPKENVSSRGELKQSKQLKDGFMTMTLELTTENATSQLKEVLNAMKVLGFKDLKLMIQSQQIV